MSKILLFLCCISAFVLSGCDHTPAFQHQQDVGMWKGYSVEWQSDDSQGPGLGFYLFKKSADARTSESLSRAEHLGTCRGVDLYFVHDDSSSSGRGFYATRDDGVFHPTSTGTIRRGKATMAQGQIAIEE